MWWLFHASRTLQKKNNRNIFIFFIIQTFTISVAVQAMQFLNQTPIIVPHSCEITFRIIQRSEFTSSKISERPNGTPLPSTPHPRSESQRRPGISRNNTRTNKNKTFLMCAERSRVLCGEIGGIKADAVQWDFSGDALQTCTLVSSQGDQWQAYPDPLYRYIYTRGCPIGAADPFRAESG